MGGPAKMRSVTVFVKSATYPAHTTVLAYGAYDAIHDVVREGVFLQLTAEDHNGRELEFIAQPTAWRVTTAVPYAEPLFQPGPKKPKAPKRRKKK